jgi:hypothetical protein
MLAEISATKLNNCLLQAYPRFFRTLISGKNLLPLGDELIQGWLSGRPERSPNTVLGIMNVPRTAPVIAPARAVIEPLRLAPERLAPCMPPKNSNNSPKPARTTKAINVEMEKTLSSHHHQAKTRHS